MIRVKASLPLFDTVVAFENSIIALAKNSYAKKIACKNRTAISNNRAATLYRSITTNNDG